MLLKGALQQALVTPGFARLIEQCHTDTWFVVQGVSSCAAPTAGSQAGDPLGDLFFVVIYVRVQKRIRNELDAAGLVMRVAFDAACPCWCPSAGASEQVDISDGSYLDDTFYMLEAELAE